MPTYSGHIRKKPTKKEPNKWQLVIELGYNSKGERKRQYESFNGTKKDATAALNETLNKLNKGLYIEPSKITLAEYLDDWIKTYAIPNLSPTTVDGYKVNINNHIVPLLGDFPMQQVQPMQIQRMYETLSKKPLRHGKIGLSPKSIKYIHNTLHEALNHACRMQIIDRNPSSLVTTPKIKKFKSSVYDEDLSLKLIETAKNTDMEISISIAIGLGLRRGELLALRWSDIDFKKKCLIVNQNLIYSNGKLEFKDPKTESSIRKLELPEGLISILKRHQIKQKEYKLLFGNSYQDNNLVCCHEDGTPFVPGSFSHKFERFLASNNLPKTRLHDLRHANASLMLQYGIPAKVASERLGHSSIGITMDLYSHVAAGMQKDAAEKINNGIFLKVVDDMSPKVNII